MVEALAGEGAVAEHVLVEVGNREDIGVDAAIGREDALQEGGFVAGGQRRRDARLQDRVARRHPARLGVDQGTVERMVQLAGEPGHAVAHHARVAVERHHVHDALGQRRLERQECGVRVAAQQEVQLVQLAALALPAHPALLAFIVDAAAVQQVEQRRALGRVALVQPGDLGACEVQDLVVLDALLEGAVGPVRQQREGHRAARVGEVVHLQPPQRVVDLVARADQRRHHDQRARLFRHAVLVLVADQPCRLQEQEHDGVEEAERALARRHCEQHQQQPDLRVGQADRLQRAGGHHHQEHGEQEHRHHDAGPAGAPERPVELRAEGRPVADRAFQFLAPRADQEEADIGRLLRARRAAALGRLSAVAGKLGGAFGHLVFGQAGAPRQVLDRRAVLVARGEVERLHVGTLAQQPVDAADVLEPDGPVDVVDQPQPAHDVAGGDVAARQRLVLADRRLLGVGAGPFEHLLQPVERHLRILRAVAQPVEQLRGETRVAGMRRVVGQQRCLVDAVAGAEHLVRHLVGRLAQLARAVHPHRDAAQVLDQHEAQQRWQRPQLADLQRHHRLEAFHDRLEAAQRHRAVGMRDIDPGNRQRARHRRASGQLHRRQLAVEAARQVALDLEARLLDEIVVVEQPLRRRRHHVAARLRGIGRAVDLEDSLAVLAHPRLEVELAEAGYRRDVAPRQLRPQLAQPVVMQEMGPDRFLGGRGTRLDSASQPPGIGLNVHSMVHLGQRPSRSATSLSRKPSPRVLVAPQRAIKLSHYAYVSRAASSRSAP